MSEKPIYVTQPHMPPLQEFIPYLEKIWETKILTNGGPFHAQLESDLRDYLGVPHLALFSNGTLALMAALQALSVVGEVITTPYSFVATTHSLVWHGNRPIFVDIEPNTLNIVAAKLLPRSRHERLPSCQCIATAIRATSRESRQLRGITNFT